MANTDLFAHSTSFYRGFFTFQTLNTGDGAFELTLDPKTFKEIGSVLSDGLIAISEGF